MQQQEELQRPGGWRPHRAWGQQVRVLDEGVRRPRLALAGVVQHGGALDGAPADEIVQLVVWDMPEPIELTPPVALFTATLM